MKRTAIIVAGGSGTRFGSAIPKQFVLLRDKPILMHTIERFASFDSEMQIIVVLPSAQIDYWKQLCTEHKFAVNHTIANGGKTRFESVSNGLRLANEGSTVAVHDGVRPLVSHDTLQRTFALAEEKGSAIPVMPSKESVRMVDKNGASHAVDRQTIRLVQTPQVFQYQVIKKAYELPFSELFTDDASVVEAAGMPIYLTAGNSENIKITTPDDLLFAEAVLQ